MARYKEPVVGENDTVFISRWPWKKEEKGSIIFFLCLPLILLAVLLFNGEFHWTIFAPILAGGIISSALLYWVGSKRKKNSQFKAVLSPDSTLQVAGKIPTTKVDFYSKIILDDVRSAAVKPLGLNAAFILHARDKEDEDVSLVIPYRLAYCEGLREKMVEILETAQKTEEAEEFTERLKKNQPPTNYKRELRIKNAGEEPEWKKAAEKI